LGPQRQFDENVVGGIGIRKNVIVFVHLLNDRSGSPKVLAAAIAIVRDSGEDVQLFVGSDGEGCLNDVHVPTTLYWYRRGQNRWVTLLTFIYSQIRLFIHLLRAKDLPPDALIYVNTLLPFGAALFGLLTGRRVIYHLHEVSVTPALFKHFLIGMARCTGKLMIYVSDFHRKSLPIGRVPSITVHNALDPEFLVSASKLPLYQPRRSGSFRVVMLTSLRGYKGVPEFLRLAAEFLARPDVVFHLVANEEENSICRYFADKSVPVNVTVFPRTSDPASHYATASLVVNLTRTDLCQETFGLTLLEAMACGVPVIAPPVGGPLELVTDQHEGFLVDSRDVEMLVDRVHQLVDSEELCMRFSAAAQQTAAKFSPEHFALQLRNALQSVDSKKSVS
jgi:L-malate glycosyltransferase